MKSYAATNECILEIKVLNLSLSLLSILIVSLVKLVSSKIIRQDKSSPNKDVTLPELNNTAMNDRMVEIKALNLSLSLLYMIILVS